MELKVKDYIEVVNSPYCDVKPGVKGEIVTEHLSGFGVKIFMGLPDATHSNKQIGRILFFQKSEIKKWNQKTN